MLVTVSTAVLLAALLGQSPAPSPPATARPAGDLARAGAPQATPEDLKKQAHQKAMEAGRLIERGELKQAEALAREAVAADPESAETHYTLGLCYEAQGNLAQAEAEYKKMGVYAPEPLLELSLARLYLRQGRLDEAEQQARSAVKKNPWVPQPHLSLGAVAMRKRDYKIAIEEFSAAVQADPREWNSRISLADAYRAVGRFNDALTEYSQALALKPDHPEALLGQAQAWEQLARQAEAIAAYEKLLEVASNVPPGIKYRLAKLYNQVADPKVRNPQRAVELATAAADASNWENREVLQTLAEAYQSAGQPDKAREVLRKAERLPATKR
jgi:superkiller protein 3